MTAWHTYGDKKRFAFEYRFLPDPHSGQGAQLAESASWGAFRLWHRGFNLCEHRADGILHDHVAWYLLPLLQWLAENWDPLFHEHRFPEAIQAKNARHGYMKAVKATLGDPDPVVEARAVAWQSWWQRHSLRACREGGLFPDLFVRRVMDYVELSWGNQELPGTPAGFYFTVPAWATFSPVPEIADPLYKGLRAAIGELSRSVGNLPEVAALNEYLRTLENNSQTDRNRWYIAPPVAADRPIPGFLDTFRKLEKQGKTLADGISKLLYIERLSPVVAMFGSLSPNISARDADILIAQSLTAYEAGAEPEMLSQHVEDLPLTDARADYDEGYDLALNLLEALGLPDSEAHWIDITVVLNNLEIAIHEVALDDRGVRGVALAGGDVRPTIVLNTAHPMNTTDAGRRFTLAHELCHILHDRDYGSHLAMSSGPWAPAGIERRANAFAAMLLMPPEIVNRALANCAVVDSTESIRELSKFMHTSLPATLEHLVNIGKVDEEKRDGIRSTLLENIGKWE